MKKNLLFVFAAMLTMACCVFAADWVQIAEKQYLDASSLTTYNYNLNFDNDIIYSIWQKRLNNGTENWKEVEKNIGKKLWYEKSLQIVNCSKKEIAVKSIILYDIKENAIFNYDYYPLDWQSIAPETIGESIYTDVCRTTSSWGRTDVSNIIHTPTGSKIRVRSHK